MIRTGYHNSFRWPISTTKQGFVDKEIANVFIHGNSNSDESKAMKARYGFRRNEGLVFLYNKSTNGLTVQELYDLAVSGHGMCHTFIDSQDSYIRYQLPDGTGFYKSGKKDINFMGAFAVFVDIDEYPDDLNTFLQRLGEDLCPSIFYTSFSNFLDGKTYKFRLVYLFNEEFTDGVKFRYRYLGEKVYSRIVERTGVVLDRTALCATQYMNGSNKDLPYFIGGFTDHVFEKEKDFGYSEKEYYEFLKAGCYYGTSGLLANKQLITTEIVKLREKYEEIYPLNTEEKDAFNEALNKTQFPLSKEQEEEFRNRIKEVYIPQTVSPQTERLAQRMGMMEWCKNNWNVYDYIIRPAVYEWDEGFFYQIDKNSYIEVPPVVSTIHDGNKRRKKLFYRMIIRRTVNPNTTADNLLYCAVEDIRRGYFDNSDGVITLEGLVRDVNRVMARSIEELQTEFEILIQNTQKYTQPKEGVIYKKGLPDYNLARHKMHMIMIDRYYDWKKSVKENMVELNKVLPFSVGKDMLTAYRKEKGFEFEEMLYDAIDVNKSVRENIVNLRDSGWSFDDKLIYKLHKEKLNNTPYNNT